MTSAVTVQADVFNMPNRQTSLQFVTVGDPGNAPDTQIMDDGTSGYGSVPYVYQMGKYDVTVGQYVQFLNAVATTGDPYGLYNSNMSTFPYLAISQVGSPGSYSYELTGANSQGLNCPIVNVSWGDAARFCNWLQNGQPTAAEGTGTTETGAYTLDGATSIAELMAVTRNANALYFIPTENEWYKAAYYVGGGTNAAYWLYPTQSNSAPSNVFPATGANSANYLSDTSGYSYLPYGLTPVGAFSASPGPYGTYDMGGDVFQWNETAVTSSYRGFRGGSFYTDTTYMISSYRAGETLPSDEYFNVGFRVASVAVPEPGRLSLSASSVTLRTMRNQWCNDSRDVERDKRYVHGRL